MYFDNITTSKQNNEREKIMKQSISITVDHNNESLVFKLIPATTLEAFLEDIEDIVSVDCIQDGVDMGLWSVA